MNGYIPTCVENHLAAVRQVGERVQFCGILDRIQTEILFVVMFVPRLVHDLVHHDLVRAERVVL
jgi:hypothetical protein